MKKTFFLALGLSAFVAQSSVINTALASDPSATYIQVQPVQSISTAYRTHSSQQSSQSNLRRVSQQETKDCQQVQTQRQPHHRRQQPSRPETESSERKNNQSQERQKRDHSRQEKQLQRKEKQSRQETDSSKKKQRQNSLERKRQRSADRGSQQGSQRGIQQKNQHRRHISEGDWETSHRIQRRQKPENQSKKQKNSQLRAHTHESHQQKPEKADDCDSKDQHQSKEVVKHENQYGNREQAWKNRDKAKPESESHQAAHQYGNREDAWKNKENHENKSSSWDRQVKESNFGNSENVKSQWRNASENGVIHSEDGLKRKLENQQKKVKQEKVHQHDDNRPTDIPRNDDKKGKIDPPILCQDPIPSPKPASEQKLSTKVVKQVKPNDLPAQTQFKTSQYQANSQVIIPVPTQTQVPKLSSKQIY